MHLSSSLLQLLLLELQTVPQPLRLCEQQLRAILFDLRLDVHTLAQWVQDLFNQLTILTSITWSCYPIVVFLGRAECHLITKEMEEFLLVVLDILSKIGMEALIVVSHVSGHGGSSSDSSGSA